MFWGSTIFLPQIWGKCEEYIPTQLILVSNLQNHLFSNSLISVSGLSDHQKLSVQDISHQDWGHQDQAIQTRSLRPVYPSLSRHIGNNDWNVDFERWSGWVDSLDAYKGVGISIDWTNFLSEKYFCGGQSDVPAARCVHHHLQGERLLEPFLGVSSWTSTAPCFTSPDLCSTDRKLLKCCLHCQLHGPVLHLHPPSLGGLEDRDYKEQNSSFET